MLAFSLSFSLGHLLRLNFEHLKLLLVFLQLFFKLLDLSAQTLFLFLISLAHLLVSKNSFLHLSAVLILVWISRTERFISVLQAFNLNALLLEKTTQPEAFLHIGLLFAVDFPSTGQFNVALKLVYIVGLLRTLHSESPVLFF